eukprot:974966-Pleurochrysis_carterae.AAC.3
MATTPTQAAGSTGWGCGPTATAQTKAPQSQARMPGGPGQACTPARLRAHCDGADEGAAVTGEYAGGVGAGVYAGAGAYAGTGAYAGVAGWYDTGAGADGDEPHAGGWLHWFGLRAHCEGADEGAPVLVGCTLPV